MNPHELLTLRQFADALGVTHRRVRWWADSGKLDTLQPQRHMERLVPASELRRLERLGFRVRWRDLGLADVATPATSENVPDEGTP